MSNVLEEALSSSVILHLTSDSLFELRRKGFLKRLPRITKEQINDQSKSNIFTKLVTAIQVFSVVVQSIVRYRKGITISQLELAVTAFSACAIISYLLMLYQPRDMQTTNILQNDGLNLSFEDAY
jgi:hypothetical protein